MAATLRWMTAASVLAAWLCVLWGADLRIAITVTTAVAFVTIGEAVAIANAKCGAFVASYSWGDERVYCCLADGHKGEHRSRSGDARADS